MVNNSQEYPQHGMMHIFTLTDGLIAKNHGGQNSTEKPKRKPSFARHPCANVPWKDQKSSPSNASGCNRHDCKPQLNVDGKANFYHLCSLKNCWIQTTYLIHPILVARNNHHQSTLILQTSLHGIITTHNRKVSTPGSTLVCCLLIRETMPLSKAIWPCISFRPWP